MSPAASPSDALLGRLLGGRFRIERELARGGMATVYRAVDERLERPVAVKVLAAPYAEQPAFVERFLAEARVAASFSHPNLAHVYDSGSDGDSHFLVLELLERHRSLRVELGERGRLAPLAAVGVALDVLAGLEPLHAHGLVHCDVKPGNVMIGADGTKLIDFGIARPLDGPVAGATSIGSLHAMSPEQLRGDGLGPSSDLFAVGVLLYECLTGTVPFPGATPDEVAAAHGRGPVAPPSHLAPEVAERLDDVVAQALRVDPARRFASAPAMATALRTAAAAQREATAAGPEDDTTTTVHPVAAPMPAAYVPGDGRPRGPWLAVSAGVATVAAVVLGVVLLGSPQADGRGTATPTPMPSTSADAGPSLAPGMVRVPRTIGMSEAEAQAAAQAAGLAWRIEWRIVPGREPGIYAQEPEPGSVVREGSAFVMQAYRER
ncbi:MAG TPA: serine/threonine-protein kinase [Candidatus Limnocylindria bacterium]